MCGCVDPDTLEHNDVCNLELLVASFFSLFVYLSVNWITAYMTQYLKQYPQLETTDTAELSEILNHQLENR